MSLRLVASLALPLSLAVLVPLALAVPAPQPSTSALTLQTYNDVNPPIGLKKVYSTKWCSAEDKEIEQAAWDDALQFAKALASWKPNGPFQSTMDLYMGNHTREPLGADLKANIMGAVNVHDNSTWAENTRIFVLCHEPSKTFYETDFGADCLFSSIPLVAYVFSDPGQYYVNHYVTFCPLYYKMPSLSRVMELIAKGDPDYPKDDTWSYYGNQGETYFHESFHFDNLTTPPFHEVIDTGAESGPLDTGDVYGPEEVIEVAQTHNTEACIHIADAYSCAAVAIMAQQKFNLSDPPLPREIEHGPGAQVKHYQRKTSSRRSGNIRIPQALRPCLPDPNTIDNHIADDVLGLGFPVADS